MDITKEIKKRTEEIDALIGEFMPEDGQYNNTVVEAMNYSIQSGGKRLRPMLMRETFRLFGGEGESIDYFMAAIEMIHTYSLIHDDLPCMDDDAYRRGRKTTHTVYGEDMALLAGDGLLNLAMETALGAIDTGAPADRILHAARVLFNKSGINGMIGGQCADVESEKKNPDDMTGELIEYIHENKTAALIEASMMIGGILAGADKIQVNTLEKIAHNVGVAFQIRDDILDVTGSFEELGKPIGSDERNNKMTYVSLYGLDKAGEEVEKLSKEAAMLLHTLQGDNDFLEMLLISMVDRRK